MSLAETYDDVASKKLAKAIRANDEVACRELLTKLIGSQLAKAPAKEPASRRSGLLAEARETLARAIRGHQAKAAELDDMHAAVEQAEAKLAGMQRAIDETAHVEDAVAEAAAEALRRGAEISERSDAWLAKQKRDELITEHKLLAVGFIRLQAKASGLELQVAAAHADLVAAREPIIQNELENLAGELSLKESEAASNCLNRGR